ncbi:MAG: TolC family protein [Nitrospiraceae bacterium]|nr:TolC family protein [Nitrospiraceae bacterium]
MGKCRISLLMTVFIAAFVFVSFAYAEADQTRKYTLQECLEMALAISPEIGEERFDVDVYKAKKQQAEAAKYPQIDALAIAGPSPRAKYEHLNPTVQTSVGTSIDGVFGRLDATVIQPIYTFGKISSYNEAASGGIKASEAAVKKKTADIALRIKELYNGMLMAKEIKRLLLEVKDDLERSIDKAEKQIKNESPWADEANVYKLRSYMGEVMRNLNEAEKGFAIARDALMTSMGLKRGTDFDIAENDLRPLDITPEPVDTYMARSKEMRPEFAQLKEGLAARSALVEAEKSNYYPQIFLGAKIVGAAATNRDKVENPYINDYFNSSYGAVFLGMKWSFDFGITNGRVNEALAEYNKLAEKKRFADEAVPFQVRKAYLDLDEARKNSIETERAYMNARKWLVTAMANFDLGLADAKEIGDAAALYALMKANHIKSNYNQRMSYANLQYAAGAAQSSK